MAPPRTWAQIAAGKDGAIDEPCLASGDAQPGCVAGSAAQNPSVPSKAELDCLELLGGAVPAEKAVPAQKNVSTSEEEDEKAQTPEVSEAANELKCQRAPPGLALEEAQTELCSSGSDAPHNLVSAPSMSVEDESNMSTAASDQEAPCILCHGSGLLHEGSSLSDPCPLCDAEGENAASSRRPTTDDSSCAPPSESGVAEEAGDQKGKGDHHSGTGTDADSGKLPSLIGQTDAQDSDKTAPQSGKAVMAPPGLGPPGVWIWPEETDATKATNEEDDGRINWPETPVYSTEVQFVGEAAQVCFGSDFIKMTVSWITPFVEGQMAMAAADLQLHLEPVTQAQCLAPLQRLHFVLSRDVKLSGCQIVRMERNKDDTVMHMTLAKVSANTCWDAMKLGVCPRPNCTWEHPAPTLLNVSVAGILPTTHTPLSPSKATYTPLSPSKEEVAQSDEKIQSTRLRKDCPSFQPMINVITDESQLNPQQTTRDPQLIPFQLNLSAFSDDSSDDEM